MTNRTAASNRQPGVSVTTANNTHTVKPTCQLNSCLHGRDVFTSLPLRL